MSTRSLSMVGDFYAVEPGQGELEYYPGSLTGLCGAMKRAQQLSVHDGVQWVLRIRGRQAKPVREYANGRETERSRTGMIPARAPVPPPPSPIPSGRRPRRFDINEPPCNNDNSA